MFMVIKEHVTECDSVAHSCVFNSFCTTRSSTGQRKTIYQALIHTHTHFACVSFVSMCQARVGSDVFKLFCLFVCFQSKTQRLSCQRNATSL